MIGASQSMCPALVWVLTATYYHAIPNYNPTETKETHGISLKLQIATPLSAHADTSDESSVSLPAW